MASSADIYANSPLPAQIGRLGDILSPQNFQAIQLQNAQTADVMSQLGRAQKLRDLLGGMQSSSPDDIAQNLAKSGFADEAVKYQQVADAQRQRQSQILDMQSKALKNAYGQIYANPTGDTVRAELSKLPWLKPDQIEAAAAATDAMPEESRQAHFLALSNPELYAKQQDAEAARQQRSQDLKWHQDEVTRQAERDAEAARHNRAMESAALTKAQNSGAGALPKPQPGYMWTQDSDGNPQQVLIKGSKSYNDLARSQIGVQSHFNQASSEIDKQIGRVTALMNDPALNVSTGVSGIVARQIPGTSYKSFNDRLDTILANGQFNALQDMRNASKTGGALGNISDAEGRALRSSVEALDPKQSPADFKAALARYVDNLNASKARLGQAYDADYSELSRATSGTPVTSGPKQQPTPNAPASSNIDDILKKHGVIK